MKKTLFLVMGLSLALSACMPAFLQPTVNPTSQVDLNATAAVLVTASLAGALPSPTIEPSNTPVVTTATSAATQVPPVTPSETQTLTATIGMSDTPTLASAGVLPSATLNPVTNATSSTTPHPQHFGTMPPFLPFGNITLINRSKAQAYISLQCTTKEGFVTIIEYPVRGPVNVKAPAGKYVFVAWVGGRKMVGNFALDKDGELTIKLYKDKVVVGK
jgi:hypothetical protein